MRFYPHPSFDNSCFAILERAFPSAFAGHSSAAQWTLMAHVTAAAQRSNRCSSPHRLIAIVARIDRTPSFLHRARRAIGSCGIHEAVEVM
jgi:hypothetical protein